MYFIPVTATKDGGNVCWAVGGPAERYSSCLQDLLILPYCNFSRGIEYVDVVASMAMGIKTMAQAEATD